jgi:sugar lactone lactonase YvrE
VQSVVVDDTDCLWVLDPAAPKIETVTKGGPKLVKFDLNTNRSVQTIFFDESIAPLRSYLNDVRVDNKTGHAFITESGMGALIVVDLKTGKSRRLLASDDSTKAVEGEQIMVDGMKILDPATGKAPQLHADGIALDNAGGWLYFHPLTGTTLFRIKTADLCNEALSNEQLAAKVQNLGKTPKPDGMLEAPDGTVFLTALEQNALVRFDPRTSRIETIISRFFQKCSLPRFHDSAASMWTLICPKRSCRNFRPPFSCRAVRNSETFPAAKWFRSTISTAFSKTFLRRCSLMA